MKIRESKNLKWDRMPQGEAYGGIDKIDPRVCILESFNRLNDTLNLVFKNRSWATIRAVNIEGGNEIDLIENKLNDLLDKCYDDILDFDF